MLRRKKRVWTTAKQSNDYTPFKKISKSVKAVIRPYRRSKESRIIHNHDRKLFFSYIYSKSSNQSRTVHFCANDAILPDSVAAELLLQEFYRNFSYSPPPSVGNETTTQASTGRQLNCTLDMIIHALSNYSNTNSSPDGI